MKLANKLTLDGGIVKKGAGTLELAGTLCFTDGQPETEPTAEKNLLSVEAGTLKVTAAQALNGAAVTLAQDLVVPVCTVAAGAPQPNIRLVRYGRYASTLAPRTNGDGSTTYVATYQRSGLTLLVR